MVEKSSIKEIAGLGVLGTDCGNCGKSVRVQVNMVPIYAMGGGDNFCGGNCCNCGTILWSVLRWNTVLGGFYMNPGTKSVKDHVDSVKQAFLKSLPPCPVCEKKIHDEFVDNSAPKSCMACPDCHSVLPAYRDVTLSEVNQDVYLFWESEEDMRNDKKLRTARRQQMHVDR